MDDHQAIARWRAIALLAAIVGAGASAYLLVEYVTGQTGVCLTGSGCDLVRASAFAYPLGIPMPLLGLVFYAGAAWIVLSTVDGRRIAGLGAMAALLAAASAGFAVSLALTGIEAFVITAFCSWCLVQAAASLILLAASVQMTRRRAAPAEDAHSARRRQQAIRRLDEERAGLRRTGLMGAGGTALLVGSLLVVGGLGGAPGNPADGSTLAPAANPRTGNGAVTVVEFADFQCPACAAVAPMLADLAAGDELTLVYRYFPLVTIHANADASARAAAAADAQGSFWKMSERLYATQASWETLPAGQADAFFGALATSLGMDGARWQADYVSGAVAAAVNRDLEAALALNLSGTPTLYIGGRQYTGSFTLNGIRAAIAAAASPA